MQEKFETEFCIYIDFQQPTQFQSYGDTCSTDYTVDCSHLCTGINCEHIDASFQPCPFTKCLNTGRYITNNTTEYREYSLHHKNAYNILYRLPDPAPGTKTLAYIGHNTCFDTGEFVCCTNDVTKPNRYLYGLSDADYGISEVLNHFSLNSSKATTVHEFGHLFGAKDHYGGMYPSTQEVNATEPGVTFSSYCIYGEDFKDPNVINNIEICDGCQSVLRGEISFPDIS